MRLKLICALAAVLATVTAAAAFAAKPSSYTCSGGTINGGTYKGLTVTGTCVFAQGATITVDGALRVARGASLNAHDTVDGTPDGAPLAVTVRVAGNVTVDRGGTLGLGQYYYGPPPYPGPATVVDGNITADQPQSLYLSFITVRGNIVSHGGRGPGLNFPLKNLIVGGNVILRGWSGLWIGLFRSQIGGNVVFSHNAGTAIGGLGTLDSSEIADNVVSGNLICRGNDPAAQFGDSGGGPNVVSGRALGECAALSQKP
jgi:hypothetical protein